MPGLNIGKRGLEKFFDTELRGKFGRKRNEVTSKGHIIDSQIYESTKPGKDKQVSLEMGLQAFALEKLEKGNNNVTSINIKSKRTLDVFGIHKVVFFNNSENIEFKHEALSRKVFATGAVNIAKLILKNEPKLYTTEDFF